jgi:quercetin 2,3-dioxygenase
MEAATQALAALELEAAHPSPPPAPPRAVARLLTSARVVEGAGFPVGRPFGDGLAVEHVGGHFLMLDHMGPIEWKPGAALGAPAHPHRGICTLTYLLSGSMEHWDSGSGRRGRLGPGDVQYMVAGRGVVHSEEPTPAARAGGGRFEGVQLWLQLPARDKMAKPRYADLPAGDIPVVALPLPLAAVAAAAPAALPAASGSVRVLAGRYAHAASPLVTHTPLTLLDVQLAPPARVRRGERGGGSGSGSGVDSAATPAPSSSSAAAAPATGSGASVFEAPLPAGYMCVAYVLSGSGSFGPPGKERPAEPGQCVLFADVGAAEASTVRAVVGGGGSDSSPSPSSSLRFLLLAGPPIPDPFVRRGPFVMTTEAQLRQAAEDWRAGRMGGKAAPPSAAAAAAGAEPDAKGGKGAAKPRGGKGRRRGDSSGSG